MRGIIVITPVKDSIETTKDCCRALVGALGNVSVPYTYTVYNDNSTPENTEILKSLTAELSCDLVNLSDLTDHPSPNYLFVLRRVQKLAIEKDCDLIIVESDVTVKEDTIKKLVDERVNHPDCGLIAAVTVDAADSVNYPFEDITKGFAREITPCKRHISFCCSLLSVDFLRKFDFDTLSPDKSWYDVTISHKAVEIGFTNYVDMTNRVLHRPHASRPWKHLKKSNPLKYYWLKFTKGLDKI